jgi:hypothetical protein
MAIVVEEEQKSSKGLASLIIWALVFIVVGVTVYYVFFKQPAFVAKVTPANFANTQALSQINLAPNEVINNASFQALHVYTQPVTPQSAGRSNPFFGNF